VLHQEIDEAIPAYQNPLPVATNNFFAPLRDLPMEDVRWAAKETPLKRLEQMRAGER
jgi:hypothetical protein